MAIMLDPNLHYFIHNAWSWKSWAVLNNKSVLNANVVQYDWNDGSNQQWIFTSDQNGFRISPAVNGSSSTTLYACIGDNNTIQLLDENTMSAPADSYWQVLEIEYGWYAVVNAFNGRCCIPSKASKNRNAQITVDTFDVNNFQFYWVIAPFTATNNQADPTPFVASHNTAYSIMNYHSWKQWTMNKSGTQSGTTVVQYDWNNGPGNKWFIDPITNGFQIIPYVNPFLGAASNGKTTVQAVTLDSSQFTQYGTWDIKSVQRGWYQISNVASDSQVCRPSKGSTSNNTAIILDAAPTDESDYWTFLPYPTGRNNILPSSFALLSYSSLCASLSNIAYLDNDAVPGKANISSELAKQGYTLYKFYDISETDTQAYIATNENTKSIAIAFRGSESNWRAWLQGDWPTTNSKFFILTSDTYFQNFVAEVSIPLGFSNALTSIAPSMLADLQTLFSQYDPTQSTTLTNIFVTGHSLGAVLAAYFACVLVLKMQQLYSPLTKITPQLIKMINFASPPAGDDTMKKLWDDCVSLSPWEIKNHQILSGWSFTDVSDPVASGNLSIFGVTYPMLTRAAYEWVGIKFFIPTGIGGFISHNLALNYIPAINSLLQNPSSFSPSDIITSIVVQITTATQGKNESFFDGPGTDGDVGIALGDKWWNLDNWGNDFEAGNTDTYELSDFATLKLSTLKQFQIGFNIYPEGKQPSLGIIPVDNYWVIDGIKIVINGVVVYNKQTMGHEMFSGDFFTDTFQNSP